MNDNPYFQTHAEDYAEQIMATQPEFYQNAGNLLNQWLPSNGCVMDVGNGGVINYDHTRLARLDCVDLVVSQNAIQKYANCTNIRFLQGNILNLENFTSDTYDAVIVQCVIHHLAGKTYKKTRAQVKTAMAECLRILKPRGTLLIMESTVAPWFATVERLVYPLMQTFFAIFRFGHVYQFSPNSLRRLLGGGRWCGDPFHGAGRSGSFHLDHGKTYPKKTDAVWCYILRNKEVQSKDMIL